MMWIAIFLIGGTIGIILGVMVDYVDTREYRRNLKRNLRELNKNE